MSKTLSDPVDEVRMARWAGWRRLARKLPNHILSVELIRTERDETAAVFTVSTDGKVKQYLVVGDAKGRVKGADYKGFPKRCEEDRESWRKESSGQKLALRDERGDQTFAFRVIALEDGVDPNAIALGEPPPKDPPPPGVLSLGAALLTTTFDLGDQVA
jgi:hypothetical protein